MSSRANRAAPQPLRLGILGAARIAPFSVIRHAHELEGIDLVAVGEEYQSASRLERYARKHRIPQTYRSFDALLANPDIDAVYIPLPISMHADWCVKAIEAGKHVLCEKPFAANATEAQRVLEASAGTGLVVAEAMHFRYHPLVERVRQIIRDGEIGELERIDASFSAYMPFNDFRFDYATGGGGTIDMGCYPIGFIRAVTEQEPTVLEAEAGLHGTLIDRWMRARMKLDTGCDVRLFVGMRCSKLLSVSMKIKGSRGSIGILNFIKPEVYHRLRIRTEAGIRNERVPGGSTYKAQLKAFAEAVRDGAQPITTVSDAVNNARVIDAVYLAAGLPVRGDQAVLQELSNQRGSG
jgi:predicted dehydrogenase